MFNKIILIGRAGQDPELRRTKSDKAVANFNVATNDRRNKTSDAEWHKVACFDKLAELVAEYVYKGRLIYVEGRLKSDRYKDKNGVEKSSTTVIAETVLFLGERKQDSSVPTTPPGMEDDLTEDDIPF